MKYSHTHTLAPTLQPSCTHACNTIFVVFICFIYCNHYIHIEVLRVFQSPASELVFFFFFFSFLNNLDQIEGFRPEWYITTTYIIVAFCWKPSKYKSQQHFVLFFFMFFHFFLSFCAFFLSLTLSCALTYSSFLSTRPKTLSAHMSKRACLHAWANNRQRLPFKHSTPNVQFLFPALCQLLI